MLTNLNRRIRNIFLAGLLVALPISLTIFILSFLFNSLDTLSPVFTHWLILLGAPLPKGYQIPFLGVVMTFVIIFLVGAVSTNIFGKKLLHLWEEIIENIPFVRRIYKGTKQVVSSFATMDTKSFTKVILIEFPRKGAHALQRQLQRRWHSVCCPGWLCHDELCRDRPATQRLLCAEGALRAMATSHLKCT